MARNQFVGQPKRGGRGRRCTVGQIERGGTTSVWSISPLDSIRLAVTIGNYHWTASFSFARDEAVCFTTLLF